MPEALGIILFPVIVLGVPLILWLRVEREKRRLKAEGQDPEEYLKRNTGGPSSGA